MDRRTDWLDLTFTVCSLRLHAVKPWVRVYRLGLATATLGWKVSNPNEYNSQRVHLTIRSTHDANHAKTLISLETE